MSIKWYKVFVMHNYKLNLLLNSKTFLWEIVMYDPPVLLLSLIVKYYLLLLSNKIFKWLKLTLLISVRRFLSFSDFKF